MAERETQLRYGSEDRARRFYENSVLDHLNERMAAFVGRQEMVFIATADATGACDSSFRAGPRGFVQVVDRRQLAYPEYRGNGVMASLANMSENQHIGLLFVDFFTDVIGLHVNGTARVVEAGEAEALGLADRHPEAAPGRRPERWVVVDVDEAYIHCSKHIPRLAKVERPPRGDANGLKRKGADFFGTAVTARHILYEEDAAGPAADAAACAELSGESATTPVEALEAAPPVPAPGFTRRLLSRRRRRQKASVD